MDFGWTLLHAADDECIAVGSVDQGFYGSGKHTEPPRHLKSAANTIRGADLPLWNSRQVTCAAASTASPRCRCKWTGPKPCDTPQNLPEQLAWDCHLAAISLMPGTAASLNEHASRTQRYFLCLDYA
jgi:hypothetical protein